MDQADVDEHLRLAATVYDTPQVTDRRHFEWKHRESPFGTSTCVASRGADGRLRARMLVQPRPFVLPDGREVPAATASDFVADPAHRGAAQMVSIVKATKAPPGVSLMIHSSNEVSEPLYRQLFKFRSEFELTALGLPVHLSGLLRRKWPSGPLAAVGGALFAPLRWALQGAAAFVCKATGIRRGARPSEDELDAVLVGFRRCAGPHFLRTEAGIAWRQESSPRFEAGIEWLYRSAECLGYLAWQRIDRGGVRLWTLTDLVTRRPLSRAEMMAVRLLTVIACAERGFDAVLTLVNLGNPVLAKLKGFPLLPIPTSQLPHSSPMYFHTSAETFPPEERPRTFLTLADLDYF